MQTRFTQLLSASVNAVVLMVIANIVPALDLNAQELFMRGDSNGDQTVDIADATFSLNTLFVAGSEDTRCLDASDSNDDGNFDISDAVFVLLYLFGGGPRSGLSGRISHHPRGPSAWFSWLGLTPRAHMRIQLALPHGPRISGAGWS